MEMKALRQHVVNLLQGKGAHADYDRAVKDVPAAVRGEKPEGAEHSLWQVLEHLRIAQWDILEFSVNPDHKSPEWPSGYWPKEAAPKSALAWNESIENFRRDLKRMIALVNAEDTDLFAKIPHGDGQTVLREALLVADHNAYHVGEFILLRRMLGAWH